MLRALWVANRAAPPEARVAIMAAVANFGSLERENMLERERERLCHGFVLRNKTHSCTTQH